MGGVVRWEECALGARESVRLVQVATLSCAISCHGVLMFTPPHPGQNRGWHFHFRRAVGHSVDIGRFLQVVSPFHRFQ
jgi:hypothetical protein